jgi:phosphatidate cytidylyltransferase
MKRIATALVLIPTVTWIVLAGPYWAFIALLAVVGCLAFHEFDRIAAAQGIARAGIPGIVAGLLLLLTPEPLLVLVMTGMVAMILSLRRDSTQALPAASLFAVGVIYIFGAWRCAVELRALNPHWLMVAVLVSWAGDTAAMYIGRAFGKHKLAPEVSPSKTWEGAVGSVAGGTLAAMVYAHYLIGSAPIGAVAAVGAVANIAGQFGDLCESAFKRGAGVKDSGTTLPGHGGWLDRIDSSLFSVPVTYGVLRVWMKYF